MFTTCNFTLCTVGNIRTSKISVNRAVSSQQYFLEHVSVNVIATFISSHFETTRLTLRQLMLYIYIYGAPILDVSRSHTTAHHSRWDSSGRVISSSQRPLPDNTQHSQQTDIHAPGGIRTQYLSRRAVADLGLRPRGHWNRLLII